MIWLYRLSTLALVIVFSAGVGCAVLCDPELSSQPKNHADGSKCDECISIAFETGTKSLGDMLVTLDFVGISQSMSVLPILNNAEELLIGSSSPPPGPSIFTLRVFHI
jgi:hypothetical protein